VGLGQKVLETLGEQPALTGIGDLRQFVRNGFQCVSQLQKGGITIG